MANQTDQLKQLFQLDKEVTFLNFGSFGACPVPVFEEYIKWQRVLESQPVKYFDDDVVTYLKRSREALGTYVNCNADELVFVPNPTYAINLLAKNIELRQDDEILTTRLEYGAMDYTWEYYCKLKGAKYIRQPVKFPIETREEFIEQFWKGFTSKTKYIFISQITSATGLILPVNEICIEAKKRGLITIVDGAHVPGHIPLDISDMEVDYYTGACHKWMMAPKGCSFLYANKVHHPMEHPLVISWGFKKSHPLNNTFLDYHQMNGTRDYAASLTIPFVIEFMKKHDWSKVADHCRTMCINNAQRFCDLAHSTPLVPLTDEFIGQMFSIPVTVNDPEKLKHNLYKKHKVIAPVTVNGEDNFVRYSINAFNSQEDLDRLYDALQTELPEQSK